MLTKKEYCESILEDYAINVGREINESDIYQSSSVAVAMEFLGLLETEEAKEYASSRAGTMLLTNKGKVLTVRELIAMLPNNLDE